MSTVNPRQIEAFRAVILTGSVTGAAQIMRITQPAVSRLIRDLQQSLEITLFERRGTRLLPTSEGLSLYGEVERSFVGLDRIAQAALDLRTRRAGTLRIAALPALANGFLPRFVGRFLADRPKIDVGLYGLASHVVLDWVASGQCDLGFAAVPVEHPTVSLVPMPSIPVMAVMPPSHRLARKKRLQPKDFEGEAFISLGPFTLLRHRIDGAFADHSVTRQLRVETPLSEIACALVASGVGVSMVDPFTAQEYRTRGIVARPFEPRINFEFAALYSRQRGLSGIARDLVDLFSKHVEAFALQGRARSSKR